MKYLVDTTLRDGEQAPGVVFSLDEKIAIAALLDEVGIEELEVGTPAMSFEEMNHIREIVKQGFNFKSSCWCRANANDINLASTLNTTNINISFPISDILLKTIGKDRKWIGEKLPDLLKMAGDFFGFVTLGAQDASRTDPSFLFEFIDMAKFHGANRIRIADTVGIMNPISVKELFSFLCNLFPETDFEFHGHNDLGMATANAVTALQFGASGISATVNGLGERAGNAALEEVIMALKVSLKEEIPYKINQLKQLCDMVSTFSNRSIPEGKAISGRMAFAHESGIHCNSLLHNKLSYQPFLPKETGGEMIFYYGKHSGRNHIICFFSDLDVELSLFEAELVLENLKNESTKLKRSLTENELIDVYLNIKADSCNAANPKQQRQHCN